MNEFKKLTTEEQLDLLNNHLSEIKNIKGRLEDKFSNETFEFSYSMLRKSFQALGIKVTNYAAHRINEKPIVNEKQDVVKTEKVVKQHNNVEEKLYLTKDEILFVKDLFKNKQGLVKTKQTLSLPTFNGTKKTTGISVYTEIWERWGEFKKRYPMYSGTDLLALAIKEFMEKYDEGSDS